ncbi:MAG: methyltransferase domain-containing protein [Desulfobacteraceae bacterium]|nr:MAG: methyltransferase domain-containing protein [Desulfobacteraceae bacterium]
MKDPSNRNVSTPEDIQRIATAFQQSRVLLTAVELDLFTAIGNKSLSSENIASKIGTGFRATDRLLNALCAIGLVSKKNKLFSNTPSAVKFLIKHKKRYMAGLMHTAGLWKKWHTLTDAVKKGSRTTPDPIKKRDPEWFEAFIAAMHYRATASASRMIAMLDLSTVSRVLDIGGGSGAYAMAFVRARKEITATIFDLPNVITLTKHYVVEAGLLDRINFASGDYNKDVFGKGFDLAFISAIIHINSPEKNQSLMDKAAKALKPGGQVVIQDFIMENDRTSPPFGTFFALNMLVGTEDGDTYTEAEVKSWLKKSGFTGIRRLEEEGPVSTIVARKKKITAL